MVYRKRGERFKETKVVQQSWKVFFFSVYQSMHALNLVNILQTWNLCMLFISDIAWSVMKMVFKGLIVRLQRHLKDITAYGGEGFLKRILTYLSWTKCNEINMCHSDVQKHVSHKKWYKQYKYFVYKLTQKFSDTCVWGEMF